MDIKNIVAQISEFLSLDFFEALLVILFCVAFFGGRYSLKARIQEGIRHSFRKDFEEFRSGLQNTENEMSALRDTVLTGATHRRSILNARQIEAAERIWREVVDLTPYRTFTTIAALLNLPAIARAPANENGILELLEALTQRLENPDVLEFAGKYEQPFLPPDTWAMYTAYKFLVLRPYYLVEIIKTGQRVGLDRVDEYAKLTAKPHLDELLATALPERSEHVLQNDYDESYVNECISEIESRLLEKITQIIKGEDVAVEDATNAVNLLKILNGLNADIAKNKAEAASHRR
jgi:hypothetical protein